MKRLKILLTIVLSLLMLGAIAQDLKVKGRVVGNDMQPIEGAAITISGVNESILTDSLGYFEAALTKLQGTISVTADGFYAVEYPLRFKNGRFEVIRQDGTSSGARGVIVLIPQNKRGYTEEVLMPFRKENRGNQSASAISIDQKDLHGITVENAMQDQAAGLRILMKGGMPGEGGYLNMRGIHSLIAENNPLLVVNGVPYMPDQEPSGVINGYSRSLFAGLNVNDIKNVTVLKGAATSLYGSLGANGVILIETEQAASENIETEISLTGNYGINWNNQELPMMNGTEYKKYLTDIGMTNYTDMQKLLDAYPFLQDDPGYYYNYLYNNNTNWQKEIRKPSFVTDNVFRVKGGDAVAKYNISLGYTRNGGILDNTHEDRYHTLINTDIQVNDKVSIFTNVGLAYMKGALQEQGMSDATNPSLAAYYKMPFLHPYKKEADGGVLSAFDQYRFGVSNPVAIVNTLDIKDKIYDVNARIGLNYKPNRYLTFTGVVGLFYRYTQEDVFIPGVTDKTIIPLGDVKANNTVREGVAEQVNMFYNVYAAYSRTFNAVHALNTFIGGQIITSRKEYDAGSGYNTPDDVYTTLDYVTAGTGRFSGYNNLWNWMNYYFHADYTYNQLVKASVNVSLDAASVSGKDATRVGTFPSVGLTFMAANLGLNTSLINRMDIRAEYGLTGNSRFSSNFGKNYYESGMFQEFTGVVRSNVPNTYLQWERTRQFNAGLDLSFFNYRLNINADYYNSYAYNLLFARPLSAVYGSDKYYDNQGKIETNGVEVALQAALVQTPDWEWNIGGTFATANSKLKSLGGDKEYIEKFSDTYNDDVQVISRVGDNPYQFFGLQTNGVYATAAEASASGLTDAFGTAYQAGDVRFIDQNHDGKINDDDRVALGSAAPDFFGSFSSSLRYRNFTLSAVFSYSVGNDAYNAVRRKLESSSNFYNQSKAVLNRWQVEGQQTNMPRADYNDPIGNNDFSDRWIEDASFIKLRNITLSYTFNKKVFNFFRSGTFYVTGENLFTWTDYLGMDPEFSYSYSEVMQGFDYAKNIIPKTIKFGFNLKF